MTGIGFMEALLLAETGTRSNDGNFLWGYCFSIFYIFAISFVKWWQLLGKGFSVSGKDDAEAGSMKVWWYRICAVGCGAVFMYQLYCGVYFLIRLLAGETYFMIG